MGFGGGAGFGGGEGGGMTTARFGRGDVGTTTASGVEVLLVLHPIVCNIASKKITSECRDGVTSRTTTVLGGDAPPRSLQGGAERDA